MRRILIAVALGSFLATSGCVIHRQGYGYPARTSSASRVVMRQPACHPSQYWDGTTCRHKGNGWGARKHDGR